MGNKESDYRTYYRSAYDILNDARWPAVFEATEDDKARYGDDEFGLGCILARNLRFRVPGYSTPCRRRWPTTASRRARSMRPVSP